MTPLSALLNVPAHCLLQETLLLQGFLNACPSVFFWLDLVPLLVLPESVWLQTDYPRLYLCPLLDTDCGLMFFHCTAQSVISSRKHKWNYTILFQCAFISSNVTVYAQTQLSDLSFCLLLMQGSRHKNELEASPSLIADLKSPVTITLYRLIYSLLTLRDFDSYSVNTLSYPLSSIVNYQEHARGHTWAPSVILILLISQNQNLSPHPCALQGRS